MYILKIEKKGFHYSLQRFKCRYLNANISSQFASNIMKLIRMFYCKIYNSKSIKVIIKFGKQNYKNSFETDEYNTSIGQN